MVKQLQHWINGEYASGKPAGEIKIEDPALGEVIATIPSVSSEDLDEAVKIAQKAQKEWAKISLAKRVDIMFKMRHLVLENQDKMARLIVQEHGKNYSDAIGEIQRGRETLDFACGINANMKGEHSYQARH